jgi:hypothetical protein
MNDVDRASASVVSVVPSFNTMGRLREQHWNAVMT